MRIDVSKFSYQLLLVSFSGILSFLGFAGFDYWPLAFISHVPLLFVLYHLPTRTSAFKIFFLGLVHGTIGITGGYYWLTETLHLYSGLPYEANLLIAFILFVYMGTQFGFLAWFWWKMHQKGLSATWSLVFAGGLIEFIFPSLFPYYYGASFHNLPLLLQVADLGGPLLVSMCCFLVNGLILQIIIHPKGLLKSKEFWMSVSLVVAWLAYGSFQLQQTHARITQAEKLQVGLVQVNMGIFQKREDPMEGLRKHIQGSLKLESQHDLDLLIWPESAYTFVLPERLRNFKKRVTGQITTPVLFGGLSSRKVQSQRYLFNSAFLVDEEGDLLGTYDKIYLLAFAEYMPLSKYFPWLHDLSPSTGRFMQGSHTHAFEFKGYRISTLICYEDIIPGFVRKMVQDNNPHLLVNITNDAWFGETTEPWIHLALAKLRAVEHHRALVRATNSGVSAVIDPYGRVITQSGVYTEETLHASVPLLAGQTFYGKFGDWPGWFSIMIFALCLLRSKKPEFD